MRSEGGNPDFRWLRQTTPEWHGSPPMDDQRSEVTELAVAAFQRAGELRWQDFLAMLPADQRAQHGDREAALFAIGYAHGIRDGLAVGEHRGG